MKKAFVVVRPAHIDAHRLLSPKGEEQLLRLGVELRARLEHHVPELSLALLSAREDEVRATSNTLASLIGISKSLILYDESLSSWPETGARLRSQSLVKRFLQDGTVVIAVPAEDRVMELAFYAASRMHVACYIEEIDEGEGLLVMPHGVVRVPD